MSIITNGWLNVYKPIDITSSKTVLTIKKKFNLKKVGHAGTIDPLAEGILPIAIGNTTKIISFIENKSKKYEFIIKWGEQTTTDDSEGDLMFSSDCIPNENEINQILPNYLGIIDQVPPKYSAVKVNGVRAYKLSRKQVKFDLKSKSVKVFSLKFKKNTNFNESLFTITCGKGFYIRSFARDLALSLGTRGHIIKLKRQEVGIFNEKNSILLDDLLKIRHLSSSINGYFHSTVVLDDIPALTVDDSEISEIRMGKKIEISFLEQNKLKFRKDIYAKKNNEIIAFGYIENNFFKPKKVFN